jgi:uncharacterized protein involved in response to NO
MKPLWSLGFRPFYLVAAAYAAVSVPLWVAQLHGLALPGVFEGPVRHAHEMIFGFVLPVMVGFLFTAGRNWTGQPTPTGAALAALVLVWLAGRVLVFTGPCWASAAANAAFPLLAALGLGRALVRAGNRRNFLFLGILVAMSIATVAIHLAQAGRITLAGRAGIGLALDAVLFAVCVMGGRVIPMFTNNGVPGARATRQPVVERLALGSVLALAVADLLWPGHAGAGAIACAVIALIAAIAHAVRWWLWQPWRTLHTPLVWILHAAYAWIPAHLALRAAALAGRIDASVATHALTAGGIAAMIAGMITRTALGHTGRTLVAGRAEIAFYVLVLAAGGVRVLVPLFAGTAPLVALDLSAALWFAAFTCYLAKYVGVLTRAGVGGP